MSHHRVSWQYFTVVCDGCGHEQTFSTGTEPSVINEFFHSREKLDICQECIHQASGPVWNAMAALSKRIEELQEDLETLKTRD